MANIIDYLKWRGDITFEQVKLGEVDNLILSLLAFVDFTDIVSQKYRPAVLYINGEYKGSYMFTEKVGMANNSVDIDEEDGYVVELDTYSSSDTFPF